MLAYGHRKVERDHLQMYTEQMRLTKTNSLLIIAAGTRLTGQIHILKKMQYNRLKFMHNI